MWQAFSSAQIFRLSKVIHWKSLLLSAYDVSYVRHCFLSHMHSGCTAEDKEAKEGDPAFLTIIIID